MGHQISAATCCQEEASSWHNSELRYDNDEQARLAMEQELSYLNEDSQQQRWGCCRSGSDDSAVDTISRHGTKLDSLSYVPVRWDEASTIDVERSHARYSKIVVHGTRARTQRRTKAWEDWLRAAVAGSPVTLLQRERDSTQHQDNVDHLMEEEACGSSPTADRIFGAASHSQGALTKIPSTYKLDRELTTLTLTPHHACEGWVIVVDSIEVICPATDFALFFEEVKEELSESEKARALLVQYSAADGDKRRVWFLEETVEQKDRFVQALTALWLEKRNGCSMWF
jgi:hypothetical protein